MLLNSKLLQSCLLITTISLSMPSSAALFTQGDLTYDDATQIISGNGKEYLGFGVGSSWDYATTVANTSAGGAFDSFSIALTADADFFIGSLFGSQADACSTVNGVVDATSLCGYIAGYTNDLFGSSYSTSYDLFWFLADESTVDVAYAYISILDGSVYQFEKWSTFATSDWYTNISWLLVRDAAPVSEPSIFALMGLGIFGLGLARRKRNK